MVDWIKLHLNRLNLSDSLQRPFFSPNLVSVWSFLSLLGNFIVWTFNRQKETKIKIFWRRFLFVKICVYLYFCTCLVFPDFLPNWVKLLTLLHQQVLPNSKSSNFMDTSEISQRIQKVMYFFPACKWTGVALFANIPVVAGTKAQAGQKVDKTHYRFLLFSFI